ncbi:PucR family transcriptional regulator ligand-binding domain-containing protein [Streptomyces sp. NPDC055692]
MAECAGTAHTTMVPQREAIVATTVRWLVGWPRLNLRLLAGERGLDQPLSWAHGIELVDPTPWLSGGEVVLTTGLRLPRTTAERVDYVERLAAAGVVGLGFGVGLSHARVPAAMIEAADRLGLPLFSVPLPTPFVAITQAVADKMAEGQYEVERATMRSQQRMTRAALADGVSAIVPLLASLLGASVLVLDAQGAVLAGEPADDVELYERVLRELADVRDRGEHFSVGRVDERGHLMIESVRVTDAGGGVIAVAKRDRLTPPEQMLVNHAASLIALDIGQSQRSRDAERAVRATVLSLLASGHILGAELARHVRGLGFQPDARVAGVVIDGLPDPTQVVERLERVLATQGVPYLLGEDGPRLMLLFAVTQGGRTGPVADAQEGVAEKRPPAAAAEQVASELAEVARQHGSAVSATGLGGVVSLAEADTSLRQAHHAARLARAERRALQTHTGLRLHALLLADQSPESLRALSALVLGPLQESDRVRRGSLLETLEAFLRCNGHWETAAAELGVHRHTVRHRMRRIEEITGSRLDSAHDRAEFLLALSARRLGSTTGSSS